MAKKRGSSHSVETFKGKQRRAKEIPKSHFVPLTALLVMLIVFIFFYTYATSPSFKKVCYDESCFVQSLQVCDKAIYTSSKSGNIWRYEILKQESGTCIIDVKNIVLASSDTKVKNVQGKSMICAIPLEVAGSYTKIEQRIEFCSGPLKEELQSIIIDKLYDYVIQNLGPIAKSIKDSIG